MRIRRADGSLVPASEVIPVAERLGLVRLLDHRVLELLIGEMAAVPSLNASVNVSPASITDPDWWTALGALLRANAGVAERLIVEITETAAIHDIDDTRGFVSRVKDLGCRIAIDDFGSGYTSFRNLRKLGVDILKIDGAFVQNLMRIDDDRAFVSALVDLAKRLGLKTVAEWVQDEAVGAAAGRLGLRLSAGRADRARVDRAALGQRGAGGSAQDHARLPAVEDYLSLSPMRSMRFCISSIWRLRSSMSPPAAACRGRLRSLSGSARALAALTLARERGEHRKGALEHFHVPAHLLLDRAEAAHAERLSKSARGISPAPG